MSSTAKRMGVWLAQIHWRAQGSVDAGTFCKDVGTERARDSIRQAMANLPKATRLHIDPVSIDYTGRPNYSTGTLATVPGCQ